MKKKALAAPESANTLITEALIQECIEASRESARKRMILPLHKSADAKIHRMFNAMQPGSYIQPHRHLFPPKAESVIVLQGAILAFIFNDQGQIEEVHRVAAGSSTIGIDSEPGVYHTFVAVEEDTIFFEVKPGPYSVVDDKDFAPWAPAEGEDGVEGFLANLYEVGTKMIK